MAREEFAALRSRVRAELSLSYAGALSLDVASLDWIRGRPESLPLDELLQRLLRQLRISPRFYLPAGSIEVRSALHSTPLHSTPFRYDCSGSVDR